MSLSSPIFGLRNLFLQYYGANCKSFFSNPIILAPLVLRVGAPASAVTSAPVSGYCCLCWEPFQNHSLPYIHHDICYKFLGHHYFNYPYWDVCLTHLFCAGSYITRFTYFTRLYNFIFFKRNFAVIIYKSFSTHWDRAYYLFPKESTSYPMPTNHGP